MTPGQSAWGDAVLAAALFATDPGRLQGIAVRSRIGPVRDQWLSLLQGMFPVKAPTGKLPLNATDDSLFGGIDLIGSLTAGCPLYHSGLLERLNGGYLTIQSAERLTQGLAARLAAVLDSGEISNAAGSGMLPRCARFGVIAFDESEGDEEPPPVYLIERLGLTVDLFATGARDISPSPFGRESIAAARARLPLTTVPEQAIGGLCLASIELGIGSLRAPLFAIYAARASAALFGRTAVASEDLAIAARFVFAGRATITAAAQANGKSTSESGSPDTESRDDPHSDRAGDASNAEIAEIIVASAQAALPRRLLSNIKPGVQGIAPKGQEGRAATNKYGAARGRPAGSAPPRRKALERISLIDTLRRAAPWQTMRRRERLQDGTGFRIEIRKDDLRVRRYHVRAQSTAIFSVDASGSTALQRLAEAKGAVELVLGDCYIRRDQVALIAFRGHDAEVILHPTRSLVRAKRALAALAGGGGTPLASGIMAAGQLAIRTRRGGGVPIIVLLTDGGANVASGGKGGRERAQAESLQAARSVRRSGLSTLLIDTSPRGHPRAESLAREMGALYLPLPQADAHQISASVRSIANS